MGFCAMCDVWVRGLGEVATAINICARSWATFCMQEDRPARTPKTTSEWCRWTWWCHHYHHHPKAAWITLLPLTALWFPHWPVFSYSRMYSCVMHIHMNVYSYPHTHTHTHTHITVHICPTKAKSEYLRGVEEEEEEKTLVVPANAEVQDFYLHLSSLCFLFFFFFVFFFFLLFFLFSFLLFVFFIVECGNEHGICENELRSEFMHRYRPTLKYPMPITLIHTHNCSYVGISWYVYARHFADYSVSGTHQSCQGQVSSL